MSRKQALAAGLSASALRHRLRAGGPWSVWLSGVYRAETGIPTQVQREIAALLYGDAHAVLTGAVALRHDLLPASESAAVDILVPANLTRAHSTATMKAVASSSPGISAKAGGSIRVSDLTSFGRRATATRATRLP